jgi:hypothetical protein
MLQLKSQEVMNSKSTLFAARLSQIKSLSGLSLFLGITAILTSCGDTFYEPTFVRFLSFTVTPEVVAAPTAGQTNTITLTRKMESQPTRHSVQWYVAPLDAKQNPGPFGGDLNNFLAPYDTNKPFEFEMAGARCENSTCVSSDVVTTCTYRTIVPATGTNQKLTREINCGDTIGAVKIPPGKYQWIAFANTTASKGLIVDSEIDRRFGTITLE